MGLPVYSRRESRGDVLYRGSKKKPLNEEVDGMKQTKIELETTLEGLLKKFKRDCDELSWDYGGKEKFREGRDKILKTIGLRLLGQATIQCGEMQRKYLKGGMKSQAQGCKACANAIAKLVEEFRDE